MKVNGYEIQEAIRQWRLRRETKYDEFRDSLWSFPDEEKASPSQLKSELENAEEAIAKLQVAQMRYNLEVEVNVEGTGSMSLAEAIKRIGGVNRLQSAWREAASDMDQRPSPIWGRRAAGDRVRSTEEEYASRTIRSEACVEEANEQGSQAAKLRAAINQGNTQHVDLSLDPWLIE